jgi:regulatory protein
MGPLSTSPEDDAMSFALDVLSRSAISRAGLGEKLERKGFDGRVAGGVLERLESMGYLDDEAFTRRWVGSHQDKKPSGRLLLERELLSKGISQSVVDRVLGDQDVYDEGEAARRACTTWMKRLGESEETPAKLARRLASHLAARGFDREAIARAVSEVTGREIVQA